MKKISQSISWASSKLGPNAQVVLKKRRRRRSAGRLRASQCSQLKSVMSRKWGQASRRGGVQPACVRGGDDRRSVSGRNPNFSCVLPLAVNNPVYTSPANRPTKHKQQWGGRYLDRELDHSAETTTEEEMMWNVSQQRMHCFSRPVASSFATYESSLFLAECGCVNESLISC